jgi:hypothetical protein
MYRVRQLPKLPALWFFKSSAQEEDFLIGLSEPEDKITTIFQSVGDYL